MLKCNTRAAGGHTHKQAPAAGEATEGLAPLFAQHAARRAHGRPQLAIGEGATTTAAAVADLPPSPAALSQLHLTAEDATPLTALPDGAADAATALATAAGALPAGRLDVNGQQIDLRTTNSWLLKLADVSTPELVEVFAINTLAPFLINARLQPLLAATAQRDAAAGAAFVVNVSAMEGKFYRHKTANHPHTNMAKAALNMMTRTSAPELASRLRIYMTAVDTGWINDENPRDKAARNAEDNHFQTPIDEVDAAARILDPVFDALNGATPVHGMFLKDYRPSEW